MSIDPEYKDTMVFLSRYFLEHRLYRRMAFKIAFQPWDTLWIEKVKGKPIGTPFQAKTALVE